MIFVDTSYLVAAAVPHDALHARAKAWSTVLSQPLVTTDFVVCEFFNQLSGAPDRKRAHAMLQWLEDTPGTEIKEANRTLLIAGLRLHAARADKEWSLTDCISFEVMRTSGIGQALTYDHHFEQAGFDALLRRDPP